jgi:hypothetical protein
VLWCAGPGTMQLLSLQAIDDVIEVQQSVAVNEGLAKKVVVVREGRLVTSLDYVFEMLSV